MYMCVNTSRSKSPRSYDARQREIDALERLRKQERAVIEDRYSRTPGSMQHSDSVLQKNKKNAENTMADSTYSRLEIL